MRYSPICFLFACIIALVLAACSQTATSPTPETRAAPEAAKLLARATGDVAVRQYLAKHLASTDHSALSKEALHNAEFYRVIASALEAQGEAQALTRVETAFSALPHAYLMGSGSVETWNPLTERPLVTHLYEDDEVGETATALDANLSAYMLSTQRKPDGVVLVLYEGAEEATTLETAQARPACDEPSHKGREFVHSTTIVDERGRGLADVETENAHPGWVISTAQVGTIRSRGQVGFSRSLVNADAKFITLTQLKKVRDKKFDFAVGFGDKKLKAEAEIEATYERFLKYTTDKVTEQTLIVKWHIDNEDTLFNGRIKIGAVITEICNNEDALSEEKTGAKMERNARRAVGAPIKSQVTFSVSPHNVQASLTVQGNGGSYSAYNGKTLSLTPGTYTVSGSGYDTSAGQPYVVSSQTFTVSDENRSVYVTMRPN